MMMMMMIMMMMLMMKSSFRNIEHIKSCHILSLVFLLEVGLCGRLGSL